MSATFPSLRKSRTGIDGLDSITGGGLPTGRPTLLAGGAGCGKTLIAMTFLVRGAAELGEPGIFVSFEERPEDLEQNVASLGYDLPRLTADRKLAIEHIEVDPAGVVEGGEYDLEALFIRLGHAIDTIGAKRVVLDTIEVLLAGLTNTGVVRAELRRLFDWLKQRKVTAIITAERGENTLTRSGLEEYVSDCVVVLDHRVRNEISTRRLRVVKYRGSAHGTNEYPFVIDEQGVSVFPVTSLGLAHGASPQRIPTGVDRLDKMLGGGFFCGSSVLLSGTAGSGKSSFSATFAAAVCGRGDSCIYFAFEESPDQLVRNMGSIGIDLDRCRHDGCLHFHATRPTLQGLDTHLAVMQREVERRRPSAVVVDPITSFLNVGSEAEVHGMLLRIVDMLKVQGVTAVFTALERRSGSDRLGSIISSIIDTWIVLGEVEYSGELNRTLTIRKSRGMAHSNQMREFLLTDDGVKLLDPYVGAEGALTGSARLAQEAKEAASAMARRQEIERRKREIERKRAALDRQVEALRTQFSAEEDELQILIGQETARERQLDVDRGEMATSRRADKQRRKG